MSEQCRWFGGNANPALNRDCGRPATEREHGLVLCDVHYQASSQDPDDWSDEVKRTTA